MLLEQCADHAYTLLVVLHHIGLCDTYCKQDTSGRKTQLVARLQEHVKELAALQREKKVTASASAAAVGGRSSTSITATGPGATKVRRALP
jgi:hypothetical protein